jgi:hypothetical protein
MISVTSPERMADQHRPDRRPPTSHLGYTNISFSRGRPGHCLLGASATPSARARRSARRDRRREEANHLRTRRLTRRTHRTTRRSSIHRGDVAAHQLTNGPPKGTDIVRKDCDQHSRTTNDGSSATTRRAASGDSPPIHHDRVCLRAVRDACSPVSKSVISCSMRTATHRSAINAFRAHFPV